MQKYAISALYPRVTQIPGEPLRYWVASSTRSSVQHVVDLSAYHGNGECSCERFIFQCRPKLRAEMPSQRTECSHIREAKACFAYAVIRRTVAVMESRSTVRS